jgi:hypothetical protein
MPRSTIIASRISAYDKIINDNRTVPDTELAIFKLAICQLVDAAFGGGGGGGTTPAIVADGIDASVDINTILTRLASIDTKTLLQADIVAAIQSAADIDTIITRLTSIATNTSVGASNVVTTYTVTNPTITDTGVVAIAANATRKHAIIVNRSTSNTVSLFFGVLGAFGAGLPLVPQQSYEINNANLYTGIIRGITSTGLTASLSVTEGV